jgi:hypothetical protein
LGLLKKTSTTQGFITSKKIHELSSRSAVDAADPVEVAGRMVGAVVEPAWKRPWEPVYGNVRIPFDSLDHHKPLVAVCGAQRQGAVRL